MHEAGSCLATLPAVTAFLVTSAYEAVAQQLIYAIIRFQSSSQADGPRSEQVKAIEALLRALKSLCGDLVKVVGPREWGTDVIGSSIDAVERRDAESLWTLVVAEQGRVADDKGKGKGKEGGSAAGSVGGVDGVDLAQLQAKADHVLLGVFAQPQSASAVGPSAPTSAHQPPMSYVRSDLLDHLLRYVLVSSSSTEGIAKAPEVERLRQIDLLCGFLAGTVRTPLQREVLVRGEAGAAAIAVLQELVQYAPDKVRGCEACASHRLPPQLTS